MKLKEVIKACGELLSLDIAAGIFQTDAEPESKEAVRLLACFKQVYEQLYRDFAALRRTVVQSKEGVIDLSDVKLCRVVALVDGEGNSVPFRYSENALVVPRDGKFNLTYARLPDQMPGWGDQLVMPSPVLSERVLVYGIMREYLASIGDWATAAQWEQRFSTALQAASSKTAALHLPVRGWL